MKYNKGLTLIELCAVIAILGIISCAAIPRFSSSRNIDTRLDSSIKELLSELRLMQQYARAENCTYKVFFNTPVNGYSIYRNSDLVKIKMLPEGIYFDRENQNIYACSYSKITFYSNGSPVPHPGTITLRSSPEKSRSITIMIATNYIRLKNQ